ncbi:MAG: dimethylsulfoxide reductase subunit B [Chloroflexi bacterium]|nr:dimethylsulfoxide reductase subunit B [Chloroflexota bacterium]
MAKQLMTQNAFYLDSSACSGCKACQAACKDKHNLPVGILWRRVYEVTGGGWTRRGPAWVSDVFAYNLSLACNHCARPICVEVCPSQAMYRRGDGIVLLESDKCLGCQYCSWACPYGAPQYDAGAGRMTKCTLCADNIDVGKPPACVAACPLRVLDVGDLRDLQARHGDGRVIFPLPDTHLTEPALVIKPHSQAERAAREPARVGNAEEVSQREATQEHALVWFTLLAQTAVGAFCTSLVLNIWANMAPVIALTMLLAMIASLFHLGTPANAWRAFANLRSSWLSREILFTVLFTGAVVILTALQSLDVGTDENRQALAWAATLIGLALVYSMSRVYRLRTVPAWNRWTTPASFFLTAFVLGGLAVSATTALATGQVVLSIVFAGAFAVALAVAVRVRSRFYAVGRCNRPPQ